MSNNVYESKWANLPTEADLAAEAMPQKHKKGWTKKRKLVVAGAAAAAVLVPSAAWAAVALFGFGNFSASAETSAGQLNIVDGSTHLSKKLLPGSQVGLVTRVSNPTDASVNVVGIIVNTTDNFTVTKVNPSTNVSSADTDNSCKLGLVTTSPAAQIPAHGGVAAKNGVLFAPDHAVTIPAGGNAEVTFPDIFKQDGSSTYLCGVAGDYAVKGQIGS